MVNLDEVFITEPSYNRGLASAVLGSSVETNVDDDDFLFDLSASFRDFSSTFLSDKGHFASSCRPNFDTGASSVASYESSKLHSCSSLVDLAFVPPPPPEQELQKKQIILGGQQVSSYPYRFPVEPTPIEGMSKKVGSGFQSVAQALCIFR